MDTDHIDYQVLAPDSVAWFIQAALTADRTGNYHTRDHALAEAQRVAADRRLMQPCYDCRTTDQRLAVLETVVANLGIDTRLEKLERQAAKALERVRLGLPVADYMREQYDAENDAAPVSYWDMKLLAMIEVLNERLGVAVGGA